MNVRVVNNIIWAPLHIDCINVHRNNEVIISDILNLGEHVEFVCEAHPMRKLSVKCKCTVTWGPNSRTFSAYEHDRDQDLCGPSCRWYINAHGLMLARSSPSVKNGIRRFFYEYNWGEV